MRVVPAKVHGAIDYGMAPALALAPELFRMKDGKSADEAGKILVDEFRAKYPGWAQPARAAAGAAAVYRELP